MRIIGGKYKGRIIHPVKNFRSRPTTDFGREGLFNILENRIAWEETNALDLFSGTGSIGFEMASRGCKKVTAVEIESLNCRLIRETAGTFGMNNFVVIRDDVFHFIARSRDRFDLVFADPPYSMPGFEEIALKILDANILNKRGLFILEHPKVYQFDHLPGFSEMRRYGNLRFSFFGVPE
jgi:16S rRNA (guanine(966)-N(2))-methyltransferase RsmD